MNLANKYGFTALILAAGMGNLDIVSKLAPRSEVNVNCVEGNLCSALMIACMHGYLRIADLLLQVRFTLKFSWIARRNIHPIQFHRGLT